MTLVAQPYGQPGERIQLRTGTDGAWSYAAQPRIQTAYTVQYRNSTSGAVTVNVRPRLSLRRVAVHRYSVTVFAGGSFAGKVGYVARWSTKLRRWVQVRRYTLVQSQTSSTISLATVRFKVARRKKLRAFISQAQVQPGYVSGYSNVILS